MKTRAHHSEFNREWEEERLALILPNLRRLIFGQSLLQTIRVAAMVENKIINTKIVVTPEAIASVIDDIQTIVSDETCIYSKKKLST